MKRINPERNRGQSPEESRSSTASNPSRDLVTDRTVGPGQWGDFLIGTFDECVHRHVGTVFVPTFDSTLAAWFGVPGEVCVFQEDCDAPALEHSGDMLSCDHFVEPQNRPRNIAQSHVIELVASPKQRRFGQATATALPGYSRSCDVQFACNGECNRFIQTPGGEDGPNHPCAGYRAILPSHRRAMRLMADLVRQGRYADEIMSSGLGGPADGARPESGPQREVPPWERPQFKQGHGG